MNSYRQEAYGKASFAVATLGAREGYDGKKEYSLDEILSMLDEINKDRSLKQFPTLNCMVSEAHLVGRSGDSSYREKLYKLNFAQSPRFKNLSSGDFFVIVKEYAFTLGSSMKQQRVYIDFENYTHVFKIQ